MSDGTDLRATAALTGWPSASSTDAALPWINVAIAVAVEAAVFLYIADVGIAVASALGVAAMAACALSRLRFLLAVAGLVTVSVLVIGFTAYGEGARIGVTGLAAGALALLAAMGSTLAGLANRTLDRLDRSYADAVAKLRESVASYQVARARVLELGATVDVYWETDATMRLRFLSRAAGTHAQPGGRPRHAHGLARRDWRPAHVVHLRLSAVRSRRAAGALSRCGRAHGAVREHGRHAARIEADVNSALVQRWVGRLSRIEQALLPAERFPRTQRQTWIRVALLAWVGLAVLATSIGLLVAAARLERDLLAVAAIALGLLSGALVLQVRMAPRPHLHPHGLLLLVSATGLAVDLAAGGSGLGALALLPFVFAIAFLLLPEREVAIWWILGLLALGACSLAPASVVGTTAIAVPMACSIALALLVGLLVVSAFDKLRGATREVLAQCEADDDAARRERRRIDQFVAMPGDWYLETDEALRLTFVSPGFANYLAIAEGVVLGRPLESLLLGRFPGIRGLVSVVRSMRREFAFAHYLFAWNPDQARGDRVAVDADEADTVADPAQQCRCRCGDTQCDDHGDREPDGPAPDTARPLHVAPCAIDFRWRLHASTGNRHFGGDASALDGIARRAGGFPSCAPMRCGVVLERGVRTRTQAKIGPEPARAAPDTGPPMAAAMQRHVGVDMLRGIVIVLFGRVPLFFYLLHVPLIYLLAAAWSTLSFRRIIGPFGDIGAIPGYAPSLTRAYLAWSVVLLLLYPACVWYDGFKRRHPQWRWLRLIRRRRSAARGANSVRRQDSRRKRRSYDSARR